MGKHYVPQYLLRKFESPDKPGFVWQHAKSGSPPILVQIAQAAQEKNFYGPETEKRLTNEVENPANAVMGKIHGDEALSPQDRTDLARYVGTMIRRTPFHRQWAASLTDQVMPKALETTSNAARELVPRIAAQNGHGQEWIAERMAQIEQTIKGYAKKLPNFVVKQRNDPFPSDVIVAALLDMTWRIVRSAGPQFFIISDNPACFFRWEGYGLAGEETEIVLPLSPRLCLHGCRQRAAMDYAYVDATQKIIREINKRIVSQATRFVYAPERPVWLPPLLARSDLGVMRLGWS